ncbi:glyoxalase [Ulvibacter litoralis]|uniref:Glyoxalase n=1 Tax=Ulvibacter litoralis TaxID=227084 RepID=A0A1G7FD17_9FLAO|nr:glyoxalase [Ulvibacter litoralis]GHC51675.1 hypothetical protein GCM10008083_14210 [Ulvibacter litoralis]SDE73782.1 hypothetical protein SAMN05421855_102483 [Ulvibacter litoralis]
MKTRDEVLKHIRPQISSAKVTPSMTSAESFQNNTLRPIIKLQNDLLVAVFKNYVWKHKNIFHTLSVEKQLEYIENAVQKDIKFRNALKGIIIGHFTLNEYTIYTENSSALNKRMMNIVKERLKDNLLQLAESSILSSL